MEFQIPGAVHLTNIASKHENVYLRILNKDVPAHHGGTLMYDVIGTTSKNAFLLNEVLLKDLKGLIIAGKAYHLRFSRGKVDEDLSLYGLLRCLWETVRKTVLQKLLVPKFWTNLTTFVQRSDLKLLHLHLSDNLSTSL